MKLRIPFLVLILLGMSFPLFSQEAKTLIVQGDELYLQRGDLAKAKAALAKYQEALTGREDKYEAYWRISRAQYWIGDHTEGNDQKKAIFQQGIEFAKKAIELGPDKPDGHFWLGVNYGTYGEAKGVLKSLALVKPIKAEMNAVIRIDQSYEGGGADRVLGRVYFKLPGFAGGSNKKSLQHLLKAKELGPNDPLTRVYLAETYLALDEVEKARTELEFVVNMEPDATNAPDVEDQRGVAKKLLEKKDFRKK
jgi:tetratricopeptide (TPR) repeat protein